MMDKKLPWILLAMTALIVVVIVTIVAVMVGLDFFRLGDTSITVSTPTRDFVPSETSIPGTAAIRGIVWHDLCASGAQGQPTPSVAPDGCVSTAGGGYLANGVRDANEPGIAGVSVRLGQGACPAVGFYELTTAVDGSFSFGSLPAGTYCLSVDPAVGSNPGVLLPGGWSVPLGASQALQTVTLVEGEQNSSVAFGWDYQFLPLPPTITPTATNTPTPTMTSTPTVTATPTTPCDWASFVSDVTVPDGTTFKPDQDFRKTWRLKNLGTCTWTTDYDLVFVSGNRMTGDKVTALKASVKPGQTIDISIELTAPVELGKHTGYWGLRNASGAIFGIGPQAKDSFWVIVQVEKPRVLVFNMADDYCLATWRSAPGTIECPTEEYDVSGFVQYVAEPVMEGGRVENEPGLWIIPEGISGGYLTGTYPAFRIRSGDHFRAVVSCLDNNKQCDVQFRVEYQIGDGEVKTLGKWNEIYDGGYTKIDLDLSPIAGKDVKLILTVRAGDEFDQDSGLWLFPSVWRQPGNVVP